MNPSKPPFLQGNRTRITLFFVGIALLVVSIGFVGYTQLSLSQWKEVQASRVVNTGNKCGQGSNAISGTWNDYIYTVDGKEYTLSECLSNPGGSTKTITYNPVNPSESIINVIGLYQILAIAGVVMGAVLALGARFATR